MQRRRLRNKDVRELIKDLIEVFGIEDIRQVFPKSKISVDSIEVDNEQLYVINGLPLIIKTGGSYFPTLAFDAILENLPYVIVDVGAVPYVCDGADVMAPGIKSMEGEIEKDSIVLIFEEKHKKRIAIGKSIFDIEEMRNIKKGKVIENIHYVGDKYWRVILESKAKII